MTIEANHNPQSRYAAERGHWYTANGAPAYQVPYADPRKGMRDTTLRDAKKLNLYPSVTSVIGMAARPGLEKWKAEQLLLAGMTLPRIEGESSDDFIKRVYEDSRAQAELARAGGIAIHADLKRYFAGEPFDASHTLEVESVATALNDAFPKIIWTPESTFTNTMWGYGGAIDLYGERVDPAEPDVVIDFKTTEFTLEQVNKGEKNLVWDEHLMQGIAYANGIGKDNMAVANLYISTSVPGLVYLHQWSPDQLKRGWAMFKALLAYWQASREYIPGAVNE